MLAESFLSVRATQILARTLGSLFVLYFAICNTVESTNPTRYLDYPGSKSFRLPSSTSDTVVHDIVSSCLFSQSVLCARLGHGVSSTTDLKDRRFLQ